MKLIIMIPCFNESETLPLTLSLIPRQFLGVDTTEVLVVNDGSCDSTAKVAIDNGVDYIVSHKKNRGLANAFSTGLSACLSLNADIIVNTDADNQYDSSYIQDLISPIIANRADIVIGVRPIMEISEFSLLKKQLQRFGSIVVSKLAGIDVSDTTSGFRAYSRTAAQQLSVVSRFTYTLETLIQAGRRRIPLECVPIKTNSKSRDSRLFSSNFAYIVRSIRDMLLISTQIRPLYTFSIIGAISFFSGFLLGVRFVVLYLFAPETFYMQSGYVQSLLLGTILMLFGSTSFLVGLLADQIGANRILLEKVLAYQMKQNSVLTSSLDEATFTYVRQGRLK